MTLPALRDKIQQAEDLIRSHPASMVGDCCPLKHTFVDGAYVREIRMPKGLLLTSKIHKVTHPFFILKGEVSVVNSEEDGGSLRIKAPYWGVTPSGTKRVLYIHEDTTWVTVHVTKERSLDEIEKEIIATSYEALESDNAPVLAFKEED